MITFQSNAYMLLIKTITVFLHLIFDNVMTSQMTFKIKILLPLIATYSNASFRTPGLHPKLTKLYLICFFRHHMNAIRAATQKILLIMICARNSVACIPVNTIHHIPIIMDARRILLSAAVLNPADNIFKRNRCKIDPFHRNTIMLSAECLYHRGIVYMPE